MAHAARCMQHSHPNAVRLYCSMPKTHVQFREAMENEHRTPRRLQAAGRRVMIESGTSAYDACKFATTVRVPLCIWSLSTIPDGSTNTASICTQGLGLKETQGDGFRQASWDQLFAALPPRREAPDDDHDLHFEHTKKCKGLFDHLSRLQTSSMSCGFLYITHAPDAGIKTRCFAEISGPEDAQGACLRLWSGRDHEELYHEIPLVNALVNAHSHEAEPTNEQCFCVVAPSVASSGSSRTHNVRTHDNSR